MIISPLNSAFNFPAIRLFQTRTCNNSSEQPLKTRALGRRQAVSPLPQVLHFEMLWLIEMPFREKKSPFLVGKLKKRLQGLCVCVCVRAWNVAFGSKAGNEVKVHSKADCRHTCAWLGSGPLRSLLASNSSRYLLCCCPASSIKACQCK